MSRARPPEVQGRLALLAAALDAPGLQLTHGAGASRWRGPLGEAGVLPLQAGQPHRHQRLQLLRRLLDLQPDGRWALQQLPACLAGVAHPALLRRLFLWLDGQRVDRRLAQRFPGALADLALDPAPPLPAWLARARPGGEPVDAQEALQLALQWQGQLLAGPSSHRGRPRSLATSGPLLQIQPAAGRADGEASAHGGAGAPGDGSGTSRGQGGGPAPGMPGAPAPARPVPHAAADGADVAAAVTADDGPATVAHRARARPGPPTQGPHTTWHDEWDVRLQAHRRHWTAVHERRLQGTDLQFMAGLHARFPALSRQIRRRFASLHGDAPRRERRLRDGDAVDLDAALDALVARRAGHQHADDRLYQARPLRQRSLSVALLLDMSSSTGFPIPSRGAAAPEPLHDDVLWHAAGSRLQVDSTPRRRVIDVARDAVALLCEALHALGDRHAVFGFSGAGRLNVDFAVVKDFADPWSAPQAAALAAVQPQGATRTGAAVRHAVRRLQAEPSRRKLLIVLSDGYPQDSDYGEGEQVLEHGLQDTAQALREAQHAGINSFNLSVDAAANDYLRRICPKNRYWVVDEVDALPARMLALVRLLAMPA